MKKYLLAGGLATILVLGACGTDDVSNEEEEAVEEQSTEETDSTEEGETVTGESNSESDASDSEETSESSEVLEVGDSITIDDITITVNEVYYSDERNDFHDEEYGGVDNVLVVNLTYDNNTGEDISVGMDFQVYADGEQVDTYPIDSLLGSVSDGRSVTGDVAYGINGSPSEIELEFEPMFSFSGEKGIFNVNPE